MARLIDGDDGLPAEEVGAWTKEKHDRLYRYVDISRAARNKFLNGRAKSAAFIDLFSGPGKARVKETGEWIDGSAIAAWKMSQAGGAPFSEIFLADIDEKCRTASGERLRRLGAPVHELPGAAVDAAAEVARMVNPHGLHFAFIDPFSLGDLDFRIIQSLALVNRMDMMIHLSAMDLRRNAGSPADSSFDGFAPGWREKVEQNRAKAELRGQIVEYWKQLIVDLGKYPSPRMKLISGSNGQNLYWLLLAAKHDLAHRFWNVAIDTGQGSLF